MPPGAIFGPHLPLVPIVVPVNFSDSDILYVSVRVVSDNQRPLSVLTGGLTAAKQAGCLYWLREIE